MAHGEEKTTEVRYRATERDAKRVASLAKHFECTVSDLLRRLVREEHARVQATKRPATDNGKE